MPMTRDELQQIINDHDREHGPPEKLSDRWRREATKAEAERKRERDAKLTDTQAAQLEARLIGLVASEREIVLQIVGETLGLFIKQIRDEIAEQVGELRAETNTLRSIDGADNITELPAFLRKTS
jgi:hypothetical protein